MATTKTKAKPPELRGEERIQQLMEAFPEVPRTLVIKADAIREGMRPSAGERLAGRWALPYSPWYFDYSKEDTSIGGEATEGYLLTPAVCHFSNRVTLQPMYDHEAPYEIRYEERGRYRLYRDGDPLEEVFFPPRPQWYDRKTSSGKPMPSVIQARGEDLLMVVPLTYCEYGKDNLLCKYCNINPNETAKKALGMERITAKREQDIYETYMALAQACPQHTSMVLSGGVILDSSKETDAYIRVIGALRRAMKDSGVYFPFIIKCQALGVEDQLRLKEEAAPNSNIGFNLEVWDPKLWPTICPGKSKYVGRERWLERMLMAKEIWGRTSTSLIVGLEMAQPYGYKDEDEAAESVTEGWEWMFAHKIPSGCTLWRPVPGTEFEGQKPPRTEYFLRMSLAYYKMTLDSNHYFAPKRGRPGSASISIAPDFYHVDRPGAPAVKGATPSAEAC